MDLPKNVVERLFLHTLKGAAVPEPQISRSQYGFLQVRWLAPCQEIEALCATVQAHGVTLSCKLTHVHFERAEYFRERLTNIQFKRRMIRDSIRQIRHFMSGRIAVTVTYDEKGRAHSYGWCRTEQVAESTARVKELFGMGKTQKAWLWSGPIGN